MLANQLWNGLESRWGPHTVDLMSLDSNVHRNPHGKALRHFTPWPMPNSARINLFTQTLQVTDNAYVFPPLAVIGRVLRFLISSGCRFTIVLPDVFPRRVWWALVNGRNLGNLVSYFSQCARESSNPDALAGTFGPLDCRPSRIVPDLRFFV